VNQNLTGRVSGRSGLVGGRVGGVHRGDELVEGRRSGDLVPEIHAVISRHKSPEPIGVSSEGASSTVVGAETSSF
jgi:hypothetical protein